MAYLQPYVNRFMLSYSIAMPVMMSTAIMTMVSLTSTATIEFTENTSNIVTASAQQQVKEEALGTNDI
jgi:uncharacterized membrane protein